MRTISQRRQALLDVFDDYERMAVLFSSLSRSPALWSEDDDDEIEEIKTKLVEEELLEVRGGYYTTTDAGIQALVEYVRGQSEDDDGDYDLCDDDFDDRDDFDLCDDDFDDQDDFDLCDDDFDDQDDNEGDE